MPTSDGYIVLITMGDEQWKAFCKCAGKEEWIEKGPYRSLEDRLENYDRFLSEMNELMRTRSTRQWLKALEAGNVMCCPVNDIKQVVNDPHVQAREMVLEVEHPEAGRLKVVGTPMKFSRTPCRIEKASPDLGQHTEEVLRDFLGLSEEEIQELRQAKVV